jgi:mannose-6-phosphate isomerase class I
MNRRQSNYDKEPFIQVNGMNTSAWQGYNFIINEIRSKIRGLGKKKTVVVVDCYPGVYDDEILPAFQRGLNPGLTVKAREINYSDQRIEALIQRNLTEDRVFGMLSCHHIREFFDPAKIDAFHNKITSVDSGVVLVYGTGASLIYTPDILIFADLARWEIQKRYRRKEIGNWCAANHDEDFLRKYKRGFFVDWRVIDRHKKSLFQQMDYILDTNVKDRPKMISGLAMLAGLRQASQQPFRVVPFFDPGPWGGQWMKEVCDLDRSVSNYAWCFDCVPEENSLYLKYGDIRVEMPAINLVFTQPVDLLGNKVHARFGTEFPIRFDFLDTMGGGNLSLQVHPLTEYIQETFGMHYTQDESYYILDAGADASVYLGVKTGTRREELLRDLEIAQEGVQPFDATKYINNWPAKKHDHFLIPGGTIHCSGKNSMVLEISATPFIFTFKLWDWGRLGLDGKPRPIHLDHGENAIQWQRETAWVRDNLVDRVEKVAAGDGWEEERTGLHEREFIETRRHWFTKKVCHHTHGGVNVLNLVEGEEAIVESPRNGFEPFVVHYAETFIVPAAVGEYTIRPYGKSEGKQMGTIKAFVRV